MMWTNQKLHLTSKDKGCVHFLLLSTNERLSSRWPSQHKIGFIDTSSVIEKLMNLLITCLGFTLSPATGVLCFNFSGQVSFFCKTFMVQCSFTPCYVSNYFISDQFIMSNKNYKLFWFALAHNKAAPPSGCGWHQEIQHVNLAWR